MSRHAAVIVQTLASEHREFCAWTAQRAFRIDHAAELCWTCAYVGGHRA